MSDNARIAEVYTLPSRGLIYEEEVNPEIILSSMKTKHEMLRLSATDESQKIMSQIIDDCIESDMGISSYDLCLGDFQYLMFKLRVVTFGPEYELRGKCPFCGFEQKFDVNLDDLEIREYDDSLAELLEVSLPVTGQKVKLTLQTPRMLDRINTRVREYRRRHKDSDENPTLMYTIISSIEELDDEVPNAFMLEDWVRELPLADTTTLMNRIDRINGFMGVDLSIEENCKICNTAYQVPFRINETFFRPNSE